MDRARINLILGVLFYPITDPEIQKKDYLYDKYVAYSELTSLKGTGARILEEKMKRKGRYREAGEALIQYLVKSCRSRIRSYDDLQMLCEFYYPLHEMEKTVRQVREMKEAQGNASGDFENTALFYLERMRTVAMSLLTYRDGIMAIRTWNNGETDIFGSHHAFDKVEVWNMLNSYVSPDLFMAIFIVESELSEEALYGQKPNISLPDKLLVKVLRKGMAENHLHFNAGFDYEAVWLNKMNLWKCLLVNRTMSEENRLEEEAALFRFLAAVFLSKKQGLFFYSWAEAFCDGVYAGVVEALYRGNQTIKSVTTVLQHALEQSGEETVRTRADYLMYTIFSANVELKTSSEFILLYRCYRYIKENPWDTGFARIFLQYIRIKNLFIRRTQQSNLIPGLKHFQKFFNQMNQEQKKAGGTERLMLDVFRSQSKIESLQKLEIRIAANVDLEWLYELNDQQSIEEIRLMLCRQLFSVFYLYRRYMLETVLGVQETEFFLQSEKKFENKGNTYCILLERLFALYREKLTDSRIPVPGIVFHFIKSESTDSISGYYCWRDMSRKKRSCSNHRFFLRERMVLLGLAIEQLRADIPKLNEYIVGVDAASDENAMEPWMFAPVYLKMRSKTVTRPVGTEGGVSNKEYYHIQNIGFTYHVGEDYRHIISGLRHIDEVIERFFYKPGDRLGHALALGQDIHKWIQNTETVVLPLQEYMENLLWIWGKGTEGEIEIPFPMEMLEEKILYCAKKIYHNISGISVRMLYQAYNKKFLTRHRELLMEILEKEKRLSSTGCRAIASNREEDPTYCRLTGVECPGYGGHWTVEQLISTIYCPVFEERGQFVEMVPVRESELPLYQKLQEYLQKKVARRGIYVETNPTSNLNIGDMKELKEHPIFRLNPLEEFHAQGRQKIMVMINSDDPAVFNTNIENEFAYVYYSLEHAGIAKEDILRWIDQVRQNGIDGSFISKIKDSRTLLEEISGILDVLKKYC